MIEPVKKTTTAYYGEDERIIEENSDGTYNISDWCGLDCDRLIRLHSVLGFVLVELAATEREVAV